MSLVTEPHRSIFHYSLAVDDLGAARDFYGEQLGCAEILAGKRTEKRTDYEFFGHHLALKEVGGEAAELHRAAAAQFSVQHFGVFLPWEDWEALVARLEQAGVKLPVAPAIDGAGTPEESASLQLSDPAGNGIEFKAARDLEAWFQQ